MRISNAAEQDSCRSIAHSEAVVLAVRRRGGHRSAVLLCDPARARARDALSRRHLDARQDAQSAENIQRLAVVLRRLHRLSPFRPACAHVDLLRYASMATCARLTSAVITIGADVARRCATAQRRRHRSCARTRLPCLCHNDVHHLNVVGGASGAHRLGICRRRRAAVRSRLGLRLSSLRQARSASNCSTAMRRRSRLITGIAWSWPAGCSTTSGICGWRCDRCHTSVTQGADLSGSGFRWIDRLPEKLTTAADSFRGSAPISSSVCFAHGFGAALIAAWIAEEPARLRLAGCRPARSRSARRWGC